MSLFLPRHGQTPKILGLLRLVTIPPIFPGSIYQVSPQPPRYPSVGVVIPTSFHARNPPTLDVVDNQGPTSGYDRKRHGSADTEHELSASPAKQRRAFLRPSTCHDYHHEESAREATQTGHTCLCKAGHTLLPPEEAMTLASAVALELYFLLMRPSTMDTPTAGPGRYGGGSGPPHVGADYAARMSDQGANRA
ncbi:uncharacterized protein BDCG_17249 [Blastomyces dermatitidis ER-3]|nr:uncharacterized protein BDCG_17249 [Blastomyces dermatitidis ER-3]OAT01829.1 hypothetical protein BDCG_17249 [Blastomyces dermatitidis ER-3]